MLHCGIMRKQTYYLCLVGIIAVVVVALGFGMTSGNVIIPVIIIAGAVGLIWFCHRNVTDVMTDDLAATISGRAALTSLEVMLVAAAILFAVAMGSFFTSGYGNGMHMYENGSVDVGISVFYPHGNMIYDESYFIADPANLTIDDIAALDRMSAHAEDIREFPFAFGVAMGSVVVILAGLYAAFSYYYTKKYED